MIQKYITIGRFDNQIEANIVKVKLEANGIECQLLDEMTVSALPHLSTAIGHIKLQVPLGQEKAAYDLFKDVMNNGRDSKGDPERLQYTGTECIKCGSKHVVVKKRTIRFKLLSLFLFGFPLIATTHSYKCNNCQNEWTEKLPLAVRIFKLVFYAFILFLFALLMFEKVQMF